MSTLVSKEKIEEICQGVLDSNPDKVNNYRLGKTGLLGFFTGKAIIETEAQAPGEEVDAHLVVDTLQRLLKA